MATYAEQVRLYPLAEVTSPEIESIDQEIAANPGDPALYMKKGSALSGGTHHHQEAIAAFSQGLILDPFHALLYRWRGHKHLNLRQFDLGRADLELSSRLDPANWDTWYHLGLGHYLSHDFARAETAYRRCRELSNSDDKRIAVADWLYMTLMRQGKHDEAAASIAWVTPETDPGPNIFYFRRLLMYKGQENPETLLADVDNASVDYVTLGYGLGNYYYCMGDRDRAAELWTRVGEGAFWPAFGAVASEVDLNALRAGKI